MSEQANAEIVKQVYANFKTGNIDSPLSLLSPEVEWVVPEIPNAPIGGKRRGREGVRQFFKLLLEELDFKQFELADFIAQGSKVVVLGNSSVIVKATGRKFDDEFVHVYTLGGGSIIKFHEYLDTAGAAAAYQKSQAS
jgi:ketosteroid isomerase-like protein